MTDIAALVRAGQQLDLAAIREADTPTLRAALADALKLTAAHLIALAAVWAELERRGVDLGDLRQGIGTWLPRIAAGTVAAEAVVAFAGQPQLLGRVAALPPAQQRRIAAGEEPPPAPKHQRKALPAATTNPVIPGAYTPAPKVAPRPGEPTDEDLDAACETPPPRGPLEMLRAMAGHCGPRDLAETIVEAVRANPDPAAVARQLLGMLDPIAKRIERRPAV